MSLKLERLNDRFVLIGFNWMTDKGEESFFSVDFLFWGLYFGWNSL